MLKFLSALLLIGLVPTLLLGQGRHQYSVNLQEVEEDRLEIVLVPPASEATEIEFHFPKIVPGTYSIYDFGRFVKGLSAKDSEGKSLEINRLDQNRWQIPNTNGISEIRYKVEDTYDYEGDTIPFEPAGTSFEEGKIFMLNTFALFGYVEGMKRTRFDVTIEHPEGLYGATPMKRLQSAATMDRFFTGDYYELVDSPILYSEPDTTDIPLNGTNVQIAVYSPNGKVGAKDIRPEVRTILEAQGKYLGNNLPVERYAILVFLQDRRPPSGAVGALEHSYSTLFTLVEKEPSSISQMITQVTAHEFFHIITPLTIHSEQIHDFDFQNPQMSQNLWLYEGMTEYAANHVQLKQGLISFDDFLLEMRTKIKRSKENFNDTLPFTVMSKGCLDEYKDEYFNVYEKGALIGLCLDVQLRKKSDGKYGTQELMRDLGNKYGADKPFPDDQIFDIISQMTFPEIKDFFAKYVSGSEPLPLTQTFADIGAEYIESIEKEEITLGDVGIGFDPETQRWIIGSTNNLNSFGLAMGYQKNDVIISLNGTKVNRENFLTVVNELKANAQVGDEVVMVVARMKGKKEKDKTLSAPAQKVMIVKRFVLNPVENPSEEQLALRKSWGNI